jgi:hypothetical protein
MGIPLLFSSGYAQQGGAPSGAAIEMATAAEITIHLFENRATEISRVSPLTFPRPTG